MRKRKHRLLIGAAVVVPAAIVPAAVLPSVLPSAGAVPDGAGLVGALASPDPQSPDLAELVTLQDVERHLKAFQEIADYNGGNRAAGRSGYEVSVKYVVGQLEKAGFSPRVQEFTYPFWREESAAVLARTAPSKKTYKAGTDFATFSYSGSGDVTARVTPVDIPSKGEGTSGCQQGDFKGFKKGAIALVQRGGCTFGTKASRARAAGASAVLIYNLAGEQGPVHGTVGERAEIPVLGPSAKLGAALLKAAKNGRFRLRVKTDTEHGKRTSSNVIADTERGRDDNVVVLGGHLDSVPEGAGINDNATGSAALLAIASKIGELGAEGLRNRVRFAWWGAEEEGLRGARHYVEALPRSRREDIALYLNFDMLGSPNGTRGVYDGDHSTGLGTRAPAGSGAIEKMFRDYFASRKLPTTEKELNGRSDYGPFVEHGIASGGMATGAGGVKTAAEAKAFGGKAGKVYDPCYHTECDRLSNVHLKFLGSNVAGIAHVTQQLAASTVAVNGEGDRVSLRDPSYRPVWQGPDQLR